MQTSDPDIYAVGDCVECKSLISGQWLRAPYGDIANLQGRVAGQNVINANSASFPGITQTGICKIFDFTVGFTGLSAQAARAAGFDDIEIAMLAEPALTTVHVPHREMGRRAAGMLIGMLRENEAPESVELPTDIRLRQSLGRV